MTKLLVLFTITFISINQQLYPLSLSKNAPKNQAKFWGYYKQMSIHMATGKPIFANEMNEGDLDDLSYYFKKYTYYNKRSRTHGIRCEFYRKRLSNNNFYRVGKFYYEYIKKNKVILKTAIWYNKNSNLNHKPKLIQYYRKPSQENKYTNEFIYFNDYGIQIRKVTYIYINGELEESKTESQTDIASNDYILGEPEY